MFLAFLFAFHTLPLIYTYLLNWKPFTPLHLYCEKILPLVFARQLEQKLVKSNSENTRPKILFTFTMIISPTRCLQPFMIGFTFNIVMNTLFQLIYYFYRILNFQKDSLVVSASFHKYIGPRPWQVLVIDIKSRAW